ncbi:unnamed protein product [Symbiodinium sp. CCMP2592]|nr:unnamed protein product [Symbiodinium sp. CCMP2592]
MQRYGSSTAEQLLRDEIRQVQLRLRQRQPRNKRNSADPSTLRCSLTSSASEPQLSEREDRLPSPWAAAGAMREATLGRRGKGDVREPLQKSLEASRLELGAMRGPRQPCRARHGVGGVDVGPRAGNLRPEDVSGSGYGGVSSSFYGDGPLEAGTRPRTTRKWQDPLILKSAIRLTKLEAVRRIWANMVDLENIAEMCSSAHSSTGRFTAALVKAGSADWALGKLRVANYPRVQKSVYWSAISIHKRLPHLKSLPTDNRHLQAMFDLGQQRHLTVEDSRRLDLTLLAKRAAFRLGRPRVAKVLEGRQKLLQTAREDCRKVCEDENLGRCSFEPDSAGMARHELLEMRIADCEKLLDMEPSDDEIAISKRIPLLREMTEYLTSGTTADMKDCLFIREGERFLLLVKCNDMAVLMTETTGHTNGHYNMARVARMESFLSYGRFPRWQGEDDDLSERPTVESRLDREGRPTVSGIMQLMTDMVTLTGCHGSHLMDGFGDFVFTRYQGVHEPLKFGKEASEAVMDEQLEKIRKIAAMPERIGQLDILELVAKKYSAPLSAPLSHCHDYERLAETKRVAAILLERAGQAMERIPDADYLSEIRGCNRLSAYLPVAQVASFNRSRTVMAKQPLEGEKLSRAVKRAKGYAVLELIRRELRENSRFPRGSYDGSNKLLKQMLETGLTDIDRLRSDQASLEDLAEVRFAQICVTDLADNTRRSLMKTSEIRPIHLIETANKLCCFLLLSRLYPNWPVPTCQFGAIRGGQVMDAMAAAQWQVMTESFQGASTHPGIWVNADIKSAFDTVNHAALAKLVFGNCPDHLCREALQLLQIALHPQLVFECLGEQWTAEQKQGVQQGHSYSAIVFSHLIGNSVHSQFSTWKDAGHRSDIGEWEWLFVDDLILRFPDWHTAVHLLPKMQHALSLVGLRFNVRKTQLFAAEDILRQGRLLDLSPDHVLSKIPWGSDTVYLRKPLRHLHTGESLYDLLGPVMKRAVHQGLGGIRPLLKGMRWGDPDLTVQVINKYVGAKWFCMAPLMVPIVSHVKDMLVLQVTILVTIMQLFIPDSCKHDAALSLQRLRRRAVSIFLSSKVHASWATIWRLRSWGYAGHLLRKPPEHATRRILLSFGSKTRLQQTASAAYVQTDVGEESLIAFAARREVWRAKGQHGRV